MEKLYKEYRCQQCSKLLFKGLLATGENLVEVKCKSCKFLNTFKGTGKKDESPPDNIGPAGEGKAFKMN